MPTRDLYLAAYDVTDSDRLQAALHVLKGYASGGQKSVFECFLTARERRALLEEVRGVLDTREDRFLLLPLPGHRGIRGLGIAVPPSDPEFYIRGVRSTPHPQPLSLKGRGEPNPRGASWAHCIWIAAT